MVWRMLGRAGEGDPPTYAAAAFDAPGKTFRHKAFPAYKGQRKRPDDLAEQIPVPQLGRRLPDVMSLASAEKLMWAPDLNTFSGIRDAALLALLVGCGVRVGGQGINSGRRFGRVDADFKVERLLTVASAAARLGRVSQNEARDGFALFLSQPGGVDVDLHGHVQILLKVEYGD